MKDKNLFDYIFKFIFDFKKKKKRSKNYSFPFSKKMAASMLNKNNELARKFHALLFNITAAKGLQSIVESNLGPKGTLKMYILLIILDSNDF